METVETLKIKKKNARKNIKDKMVQLSECMDDVDEVECVEAGEEALVCSIDTAKTKIKSKMRK